MSRKDAIQEKLRRLNTDTKKIYEALDGVAEENLYNNSYGWSIVQVMSHLNDAETASLNYMQKKSRAGNKMAEAGGSNAVRMWFTNQVLKSSLKWKAPSYISKPAEPSFAEMKSKWNKTRGLIQTFVEEYPDEWLNKLVYKHPIAGRQNLEAAVDSFIYHQIHHLHQIRRIRKKLKI